MSHSDSLPRNPYYNTRSLRDAKMFFGRRNTLNIIYESISNNQCVSLVGPRSIGKSSVLECMRLPEIQQRCGYDLSSHIQVFIDLRTFNQKTREDFFTAISQQLIAQTRNKVTLTLPEGKQQDIFAQLLENIKDQGFHSVLLIDAFDNVARNKEFDWDFFGFLKAQVNRSEVSYITASVKPLAEVCHTDVVGSPFFTIFNTHTLGPLAHNEARELITIPSSHAQCPFTEVEMEWILKVAGRHPLFLQQACRILFDEKRQQDNKEVNLKQVLKQIYEQLRDHFNHAWEILEDDKRALLQREAQRKDAHNRAIPELSDSALFRRFVRDKIEMKLSTLTEEDVKEAIEHLEDIRYLGESPLSNLNIVALKFQDATSPPTIVERGVAVRDILQTAFKRMRPTGTLKETTLDSRLYSILHSLYFVEHLTRVQLAARLGFSKRHIQREQNRAIEALFNILLEMEESSKEELDL